MTAQVITYEQPLNERLRVFLRLEYLLAQAREHVGAESHGAARLALQSLLRVQDIVGRVDVKQDLITTLERQRNHFTRLARSPKADSSKVDSVLVNLEKVLKALHKEATQFSLGMQQVELLNAVRQNALLPGGDSGFELPQLHYWLHQGEQQRAADLERWLQPFGHLNEALKLSLWLTRAASEPEQRQASSGFYNQALNRAHDFQLARVTLDASAPWFVVISGNPHRVNLRFLQTEQSGGRPVPVKEDVDFLLTLCPGER